MFAIDLNSENGFEKIVLKDTLSKTFVEIIPSCGAILHAFTVFHNDVFINIIDHYENMADFSNNVTSKGFKSCKLSPFACRINKATYHFGEKEYHVEKFLLNGSALHGILYDAPFTVLEQFADESSVGVTMKFSYTGTDKGYPFHYDCLIAYHLKKDNELTIVTEIIKIKPYTAFNSIKKIGDSSFDNCFTLNFAECQPLCVLRDPVEKLQIEIRPDKHYPYLQIYTPPHRNSIAIENLSAPPDTFNNKIDLITLQPGENIIFLTTFKITSLI